ncbi:hypothetical protein [Streptomyces sp. NPDC056948]|uniref:hypothetical protein n=1 Tax=Streptomyces sp. NPDC056948 TaxID=3345975 RepID=UPI003636C630
MSVPEWLGDVPTWIGAGGAIGAAWFAYQTITSQRQQIGEQQEFIAEQTRFMGEQQQNLELERAELRAAAEDRQWAQARRIRMAHHTAWTTPDSEGNASEDDHWVVTVINDSDAPVHQVDVRFGTAYLASEVWEWNPVWGGQRAPTERMMRPVHLLGPGRGARFLSQQWSAATTHNSRPTLYFTDDSGARWALDSYGKLDEAPLDGG